jgi:hypothetical protein
MKIKTCITTSITDSSGVEILNLTTNDERVEQDNSRFWDDQVENAQAWAMGKHGSATTGALQAFKKR